MKHNVKVGSRFRLGAWEWVVVKVSPEGFNAMRQYKDGGRYTGDGMMWNKADADSLDWIEPEVTFSAAQIDAIKKVYLKEWCMWTNGYAAWKDMFGWLDSHVAKE